MHRTRVKICGIGHADDAIAAARAGADAVGLIFHPPADRYVAPGRASEIVAALPPFVTSVGLFVDLPAAQVREIAVPLGLRHIQLHGHESPEAVAELREFTVLKAIRVDAETFGSELEMWREAIGRLRLVHVQGFVLETAGITGGSGAANDWETVRRHRQRGDFIGLPQLIAAGGLTPQNVGGVIRDVRPWAVDVSSGVESTRGRKAPELMRSFIDAARAAD